MADLAIETEHLWYSYPSGTVALRDITIALEKGGFTAIMGPNGSGKSTFVKQLNGLLRPTSGYVRVCGIDTRHRSVAELSKRVGIVFQNPDHQLFARTVQREIEFGPRNLGLNGRRVGEMVERSLTLMDLKSLRDRDPLSLSYGQRQRVAIASVLSMDPDILVLDEPTTGQDDAQCHAIMGLSLDICKMGKTVIVVTHDAELVAEHCYSVLIFADGCLLRHDDPRSLFYRLDVLNAASLKAPQTVQLAQRLRRCGIRSNPITLDELFTILVGMSRSGAAAY